MITFKKGNHNIKNNLEIDNKLVIFKDDANICLEENLFAYKKF